MSAIGQKRAVSQRNQPRTSCAVRSSKVDEGVRRGNLTGGLKTPSGCKKGNVSSIDRALQVLEHLALGFRRPKDPQMPSRPGDGGIEDAVRQVFLVGVGHHDRHGILLEALNLMNRDCIGDLEGHHVARLVVIVVAGVPVSNGKSHGRIGDPFQLGPATTKASSGRSICTSKRRDSSPSLEPSPPIAPTCTFPLALHQE